MKKKFYITEHALDEMDNDDLEIEDVMRIAEEGELITEYQDDKPYPSALLIGWAGKRKYPIHVVRAKDPGNRIHIITAYKPDPIKWKNDFKTRKK